MNRKTTRAAKSSASEKPVGGPAPTVSHLLGEMTWLLTQSPLHRALNIADIEWMIMPALIHQQFYVFRDDEKPVGLALWAKCSPEAAAKLDRGVIEPENRLTLEDWNSGDEVWLVDLIAPFATAANQQREIMIADLITKPLKGVAFRLHRTDPVTGERTVHTIAADVGDQLTSAVKQAARDAEKPN